MPRKHSAQANPVRTDIRAPDFCKAKSSVSQCINQKVLFWFQIIGCSDRSITCNPSGVAVERKAIIDSEKEVRTTQYVYQFNIVVRSAPPSPLVYFCMRLALLRYWHCEDEVARQPRKKLFPNTKAEVLHVSLAFLQRWRYYMCDEVGFIPDHKIPQMWVHWDLKPCCCFCCAGCVYVNLCTDVWRLLWMRHHVFYFNFTISSYTVQLSTLR